MPICIPIPLHIPSQDDPNRAAGTIMQTGRQTGKQTRLERSKQVSSVSALSANCARRDGDPGPSQRRPRFEMAGKTGKGKIQMEPFSSLPVFGHGLDRRGHDEPEGRERVLWCRREGHISRVGTRYITGDIITSLRPSVIGTEGPDRPFLSARRRRRKGGVLQQAGTRRAERGRYVVSDLAGGSS